MKHLILLGMLFIASPFNWPAKIYSPRNSSPILQLKSIDPDGDGLTNEEEKKSGTNPYDADTDNDGLPDDWETRGYGPLRPGLQTVSPTHADVIVYICWRPELNLTQITTWTGRAIAFYKNLNVPNPDGRTGINLIPIYGGALPTSENDEMDNGVLMNRYLPTGWKGIAHWHQFYKGAMGQTISPVCSSSGSDGTWQNLVHELGHHFGLEHDPPGSLRNPLHRSLMNYDYEFSLYDDPEKIQFSDGKFSAITLNEENISEMLPFEIADLRFLENSPYHYRLQSVPPPGKGTYVDWNWNGVFGDTHLRCDINSNRELSTGDYNKELERVITHGAMQAVSAGSDLYLLYPFDETLATAQAPTARLGPRKASIMTWRIGSSKIVKLTDRVVTGEISAIVNNGILYVCFQTPTGWVLNEYSQSAVNRATNTGASVAPQRSMLQQARPDEKPQLVFANNNVYVFIWRSYENADITTPPSPGIITVTSQFLKPGEISYQKYSNGVLEAPKKLTETSQTDIGVCWDHHRNQICLVRTWQMNYPNRLQLLRYQFFSSTQDFRMTSRSNIGGTDGPNRTTSRPAVVYLPDNSSASTGRIYVFYKGWTSGPYDKESIYCSREIKDITIQGGWQEMPWKGETKSGVTACAYNNNIVIAFRSAGGSNIGLTYEGTGVQPGPMKDFNELSFIRNTGIKRSIESSR